MDTKETSQKKSSTASRWKGVVVGVANKKTIVVEVMRYEMHPKYQKKYRVSKRYAVHNPTEKTFLSGDSVEFTTCKPISKKKKFIVVH